MDTKSIHWTACPLCKIVYTGDKCPTCQPKAIDPATGTGAFMTNPPFRVKGK